MKILEGLLSRSLGNVENLICARMEKNAKMRKVKLWYVNVYVTLNQLEDAGCGIS